MFGRGLSEYFAELCAENERLRTALRRIDRINDNPARFSVEINDVVMAALGGGKSLNEGRDETR